MFKKLFSFAQRARQIQKGVSFVVTLIDRADDDLDADGKSELQNILEELDALKDRTLADLKARLEDLKKILSRAERLANHVKTGE